MTSRERRVLVAGIGNVFRTDDGFGPEVARRLAGLPWPDGVRVVDYGIRGLHLAYDLLDGWDVLVLVDALPDRGAVGTVVVLTIGPDDVGSGAALDAHGMDPATVLAALDRARRPAAPAHAAGRAARSPRPATAWGSRRGRGAAVDDAVHAVRALVSRYVGAGGGGLRCASGSRAGSWRWCRASATSWRSSRWRASRAG